MSKPQRVKELGLDEAILGTATVPLLLGVTSAASLGWLLAAVGEASEELFRGDRLPVLPFPVDGDDCVDGPQELSADCD